MHPDLHIAPARSFLAVVGAFLFAQAATPALSDPAELSVPATNALDAVSARYGTVTNVACTVRRAVSATGRDSGSAEAVSRIAWERGNRLNVQKLAPEKRRTVIDGHTVWTAAEGEEKPVTFAVSDQLPSQAANLRSVPASPEESLTLLDPASATEITPAAPPFARQIAFHYADTNALTAVAVLSFDADGFVCRMEAFSDEARSALVFTTDFLAPFEPIPGVRLFRKIETVSTIEGRTIRAVSSFSQLRVNEALPPSIFDPKAFF